MTSLSQGSDLAATELRRLEVQAALDAERSAAERNKWGQFATPPPLARDITEYALRLHGVGPVRFLEPSCGSGSFYSALLSSAADRQIESADGIELDPRFAEAARSLWGTTGLAVTEGDFLDPANRPRGRASLLLANPPYVRHHHLTGEAKTRAQAMAAEETGIRPSGLSGLYVYFVLLSHQTLRSGAVSAWLIPAEFMDVNYGRALKQYLTTKVTLKRIHRFDPADLQFDDALVTSAVVVFENRPPTGGDIADFTYGGSVTEPREHHTSRINDLRPAAKWSAMYRAAGEDTDGPKLSDFFKIRRGIATGSSRFFVMTVAEAEERGFDPQNLTPLLPSPRHVKGDSIDVAPNGYAATDPQLVVIDTDKSLEDLSESDPALKAYLDSAPDDVLGGYLVKQRRPWYRQEQREPAPFVLTYMGRGVALDKPFRFIRNHSRAIATNMYLMLYPTPRLQSYLDSETEGLAKVHQALLSVTGEDLRSGGRVYGGGLHKMEPKELAALNASSIVNLCPELLDSSREQLPLGP